MINNNIDARTILGIVLAGVLVYLLVTQFKEEFEPVDPMIEELKDQLVGIFPELETIRVTESNKSYTLNKSRIYLCIRDQHGKYYDRDILVYVLIHELAHVLCSDVGHTDQFKAINTSLLERATKAGLYSPNTVIPQNYCIY